MTRQVLLWLLLATWAACFAASILIARATAPTDFGMTAGFNRIGVFLGWQFAAAVVAVGAWIAGNAWPRGAGPRWLSRVPAMLFGLLVAGIVGLFVFANMQRPATQAAPPNTPTAPKADLPDT